MIRERVREIALQSARDLAAPREGFGAPWPDELKVIAACESAILQAVREFGEGLCCFYCEDCEDSNHPAYRDSDGIWCHADTQSGDVCECSAYKIRAALAELDGK